MAINAGNLCEHSCNRGGREKKFHRSANGHVRRIMCKEPHCDKAVITGQRRDPVRMWSYPVQIALCALHGQKARSRALFQRVCQVRGEALEVREREKQLTAWNPNLPPPSTPGAWTKPKRQALMCKPKHLIFSVRVRISFLGLCLHACFD